MNHLISHVRSPGRCVALETTLLAHGVPAGKGGAGSVALARRLAEWVTGAGGIGLRPDAPVGGPRSAPGRAMPPCRAEAAIVGVLGGRGIIGMTEPELGKLLAGPDVPKLNSANLGVALRRGLSGATTISATMELAAARGVSLLATGGLGGVHPGLAERVDISGDLAALARFPVAVVCSGVKSLLDVNSTREMLEALGVPVIGFGASRMPAFYLAESEAEVDAVFEDEAELLDFIDFELARTGRGIVIAQRAPSPIDPARWTTWLAEAQDRAQRAGARGRAVTPHVLGALHDVSGGETLRVNLELVEANCALAGRLAGRRAQR